MCNIKKGDLVVAKKGRDFGKTFLVVDVEDKFLYLVNGKERKVSKHKKKNAKHVKKVSNASLIELVKKINNGESVGNKTVYRNLKAQTQKIQED